MALTNNNIEIIKAIANNDIHTARKAALCSLLEDKSKKNAWAVDYYRKMLVGNASILMSNLPSDMQTFLVGESPQNFDISRYYIRKNEQAVMEDIRKMKLIADEMSYRHIPYKNTTLLHGPSGTGKTELGKYVAYKLNLPFFYVSFSATIDSYMGNTAKNIHKIFDFCNSIPCVLMLDEVDCVAVTRKTGGSRGCDGELERTTISLMQELDRLPNHVTLIAATNRLDMVDEALLRRFSIKHEVKNMTIEERNAMVTQFLESTETRQYVKDEDVCHLISDHVNPGGIMPELVRLIGKAIYEEKKDKIEEEIAASESEEKLDIFEVTYTWKQTISAQTEEDAIAIARNNRTGYRNNRGTDEEYTAKRAEYIYTKEEN